MKPFKVGDKIRYSFRNGRGNHVYGPGVVYKLLANGFLLVLTPRQLKCLHERELRQP